MQFRYVVIGLLIAAAFIGTQWVLDQPPIPPVLLQESAVQRVEPGSQPDAAALKPTQDSKHDRARAPAPALAPLPPLNTSDDWLRDQLADIAVPWLAETELVRTGAAVLENASRGELPRNLLAFLAPSDKFVTRKQAGRVMIKLDSFNRYDLFVERLQSLPPQRAAAVFRRVEPLLHEAVRELGVAEPNPRELAFAAIEMALNTPMPDPDAVLVRPKVLYKYADEDLESLAPLQKQLMRMGPENYRAVRMWLERFGIALLPGAAVE